MRRVVAAALALAAAGCSSDSMHGPQVRARAPGNLFQADTALTVGVAPWALALADFDGDGATDVAVANLGDRSISLLYNAPGGAIFHKTTTLSSSDTAIVFDGPYMPRALVASDINADGLPDLVVTLTNDSSSAALDRIVVLTNQRTDTVGRSVFTATFDQLLGRNLRDVFVGNFDPTDDGVEIVASSSDETIPSVILSRPARTTEAADSTINFIGGEPTGGDVGVGLVEPITFWFDTEVKDVKTLANPDSDWVIITGTVDGGQERRIPVTVGSERATINNRFYTRYILSPTSPYRPFEEITVRLTTNIRSAQSVPTHNIYLAEEKMWTFESEGLQVAYSDPPNDAINVRTDQELAVGFNFWLDPLTAATAFRLTGTTGDIPFEITYDPDATFVVIEPRAAFRPYEQVRLVIEPSLQDSTNRATFAGDTLSFRMVGPLVMTTSPANGGVVAPSGQSAGEPVTLTFNVPMATPEPSALAVIGEQSGRHPVHDITLSGDGKTASALVGEPFVGGEWVTVAATDVFSSLEGDYPLAKPYVWRYLVRPTSTASLAPDEKGVGPGLTGGTVAAGRFTRSDGANIVLADPSGALSLIAKSDGAWREAVGLAGVTGRQIVRAADLDADGLLDLVVTRGDSNYVVLLRNTTGVGLTPTFADPVRYDVGEHPVGLFLGDMNGDGYPDIVTANVATNDVSVLLNNGDGTFEKERFYAAGNHPQAVAGADLDGDGDLDLVVANSTENRITLLRNLTPYRTVEPR